MLKRIPVLNTLDIVRPMARYDEIVDSGTFTAREMSSSAQHWYQKLALWFLSQTGFTHHYATINTRAHFEYVEYDDDIVQRLNLCQHDILMLWHELAKYVVVGHDVAHELLDRLNTPYMRFPLEARLGHNGITKVLGLTLVIVPWLKGVAILPDLELAYD